MEKFSNRAEAGVILAELLKKYADQSQTIVLALPRGGVPVAYEIAKALSIPLDVFIVRKLGVPGHKELAMGAIASGGTTLFNDEIIRNLDISQTAINQVVDAEKEELARRELTYRSNRQISPLKNKIIILIDDGIATGATMRVAIKALYQHKPKRIIVAVPVAPLSSIEEFSSLVDEFICPLKPEYFYAVGAWYDDFRQTTDSEVSELLTRAHQQWG